MVGRVILMGRPPLHREVQCRARCDIMHTDSAGYCRGTGECSRLASTPAGRVQRNTCGCHRRCFLHMIVLPLVIRREPRLLPFYSLSTPFLSPVSSLSIFFFSVFDYSK